MDVRDDCRLLQITQPTERGRLLNWPVPACSLSKSRNGDLSSAASLTWLHLFASFTPVAIPRRSRPQRSTIFVYLALDYQDLISTVYREPHLTFSSAPVAWRLCRLSKTPFKFPWRCGAYCLRASQRQQCLWRSRRCMGLGLPLARRLFGRIFKSNFSFAKLRQLGYVYCKSGRSVEEMGVVVCLIHRLVTFRWLIDIATLRRARLPVLVLTTFRSCAALNHSSWSPQRVTRLYLNGSCITEDLEIVTGSLPTLRSPNYFSWLPFVCVEIIVPIFVVQEHLGQLCW